MSRTISTDLPKFGYIATRKGCARKNGIPLYTDYNFTFRSRIITILHFYKSLNLSSCIRDVLFKIASFILELCMEI